jgi:hypothetical protein
MQSSYARIVSNGGVAKMSNKCVKGTLESGVDPIVVPLNDVPLEVRKKAASEPTYIAHL